MLSIAHAHIHHANGASTATHAMLQGARMELMELGPGGAALLPQLDRLQQRWHSGPDNGSTAPAQHIASE